MTELYILDQSDKLLTALTVETGLTHTMFKEKLDDLADEPFSFTVNAQFDETEHVKENNQVIFRDKEGDLRLYVIKVLKDLGNPEGAYTMATCEPAYMELKGKRVIERRFTNRPAQEALNAALQNTRWTGSVEVELGDRTTNFYYVSSIDAVWQIMSVWGGEFKDVVEFEGNRIVARKIRIIARHGIDNGKMFEVGYNTEEIERNVISYPVTALYGRGASLPTTDDQGNETGGYTRYIDFADVVWSRAKGDPVDKPAGQRWVGDPDALEKYGLLHNGEKLHIEEEWQHGDYDDPKELLQATWDQLQTLNKPEVNYRLKIHLLEMLAGYEHEKVSLGDTVRAFDRKFARPIEIQSRVISIEYDLLDIEGTGVVEMGQSLSIYDYDDRLDNVVKELNDNRGTLKEAAKPITPGRYPDIIPDAPIVEASGLFASVMLNWDFDYKKTHVAVYEVFASEVKGFLPTPETLVYRGRNNVFEYKGDTNKQYYFRVRALNYYDKPSDYSVEVTALTQRIQTPDIFFGPELAAALRELSKNAELIAENTLSGKALVDGSIIDQKIAENAIDMQHLKAGIIDLDKMAQETIEAIQSGAHEYTDEEIRKIGENIRQEITDQIGDIHLEELGQSLREELAKKADLIYVDGKFRFSDAKLEELDNIASDLQRDVGSINGTVTNVKTEVDDLNGLVETQIERITNIDGTLSQYDSRIKAQADEISAKVSSERFNTVTGEINRSVGDVNLRVDGLRTQFSDLSKQIDGDLTKVTERQATLENTVEGLTSRVSTTETEIDNATGDITSVRNRTSTLEQRSDSFTVSLEKLESSMGGIMPNGENLIPDGGFENGALGWYNSGSDGTYEIDGYSKSGKYCLKLSASSGSNTMLLNNPIVVKGGRKYRYSAWYKTSADANGTSNNQKLRLGGLDGSLYVAKGWTGPQTSWTYIEGEWTCPMHIGSIAFSLVTNHNEGFVWFDEVEFVDITDYEQFNDRITKTETSIGVVEGKISLLASIEEVNKKVDMDVYNRRQSELNVALEGISGAVSDVEKVADKATGDITSLTSRTGKLELDANGFRTSISSIETDVRNSKAKYDVNMNGLSASAQYVVLLTRSDATGLGNYVNGTLRGRRVSGNASTGKIEVFFNNGSGGDRPSGYIEAMGVQNGADWDLVEVVYQGLKYIALRHTLSNQHIIWSHGMHFYGEIASQSKMLEVYDVNDANITNITSFKSYFSPVSPITKLETAIEQTDREIALRATKTDVNNLTGRVTNAEGTIRTQADEISARVTKNGLMAELNIQPEVVKIKAGLIHLSGSSRIDNAVIQSAHINNLSGDKILANTINTSKLVIADFTNIAHFSPEVDAGPNGVVTWGNERMFRASGAYSKIEIIHALQLDHKQGDRYFLSFRGRADSAVDNLRFIARVFYTDGTHANLGASSAFTIPSSAIARHTTTVTLDTPDRLKTIRYIRYFVEAGGGTTGSFHMRDIIVQKMHAGEVIIDGTLEARHLKAETITAESGVIARAAIGSAAIASGSINKAHINGAIIGNAQIENGAITNAKIGAAAIDDAKIANVSASKIKTGILEAITIRAVTIESNSRFYSRNPRDSSQRLDIEEQRMASVDYADLSGTAGSIPGAYYTRAQVSGGHFTLDYTDRNNTSVHGLVMRPHEIVWGSRGESPGGLMFLPNRALSLDGDFFTGGFRANGSSTMQYALVRGDLTVNGVGRFNFINTGGNFHLGTDGQNNYWRWRSSNGWSDFTKHTTRIVFEGSGGPAITLRHEGTSNMIPINVSKVNASSALYRKTDISVNEDDHLALVEATQLFNYNFITPEDGTFDQNGEPIASPMVKKAGRELGFIADYAPDRITTEKGDAIDMYASIAVAYGAIQQLSIIDKGLKAQVDELKTENQALRKRIELLEQNSPA